MLSKEWRHCAKNHRPPPKRVKKHENKQRTKDQTLTSAPIWRSNGKEQRRMMKEWRRSGQPRLRKEQMTLSKEEQQKSKEVTAEQDWAKKNNDIEQRTRTMSQEWLQRAKNDDNMQRTMTTCKEQWQHVKNDDSKQRNNSMQRKKVHWLTSQHPLSPHQRMRLIRPSVAKLHQSVTTARKIIKRSQQIVVKKREKQYRYLLRQVSFYETYEFSLWPRKFVLFRGRSRTDSFQDRFFYKTYEFSQRSRKFVFFIPAQNLRTIIGSREGPYNILRPTVIQNWILSIMEWPTTRPNGMEFILAASLDQCGLSERQIDAMAVEGYWSIPEIFMRCNKLFPGS